MTARAPEHLFNQHPLNFSDEIVVDLFAGGGGASTGLEMGLKRNVDIAINHNPLAVSMHTVNHPHARHFTCDVFEVCPRMATAGRVVGWLHASPDCTHHSQARGGQPRDRKIRALAWVALKWIGITRPRVFSLENVKQFLQWGHLVAKRCPKTGRVVKLNGKVAAPGERVPLDQQYLVPDEKRKGKHFKRFVSVLRGMGYVVEWKELRAADLGAPTIRKRLFLVARRDGLPIVWPQPSHAEQPSKKAGVKPWLTAASDVIDWSIRGKSIFNRERPLADATMRRIAKGVKKFVIDAKRPFIIEFANRSNEGLHSVDKPLGTVTAKPDGGSFALATAFLAQMNGGFNETPGHDVRKPISTITNTGSQQQLVECVLSPEHDAGAERVAAFLMHYYSSGGQDSDLRSPLPTVTTKDRLALVTVTIRGTPYVIVDIQLRMLTPRELYNGQGFPKGYVIDRGHDGRRFSKKEQVHMVGNSVCPLVLMAIATANDPWFVPVQELAA